MYQDLPLLASAHGTCDLHGIDATIYGTSARVRLGTAVSYLLNDGADAVALHTELERLFDEFARDERVVTIMRTIVTRAQV